MYEQILTLNTENHFKKGGLQVGNTLLNNKQRISFCVKFEFINISLYMKNNFE